MKKSYVLPEGKQRNGLGIVEMELAYKGISVLIWHPPSGQYWAPVIFVVSIITKNIQW